MIVLDTDVISVLMRDEPNRIVVEWLNSQSSEQVWTTAITVLEIRYGLQIMPLGRRRKRLEEAFVQTLEIDLSGQVLVFDIGAAEMTAELAAKARKTGRPIDFRDAEIAGIVASRGATLATGNVRHFRDLNFPVMSPWAA